MFDLKPIQTVYKNYRFRSRLEARWAVFFDALFNFDKLHIQCPWQYEAQGYQLQSGWYLPDFYIPDGNEIFRNQLYLEIKGEDKYRQSSNSIEQQLAKQLSSAWNDVCICYGDPLHCLQNNTIIYFPRHDHSADDVKKITTNLYSMLIHQPGRLKYDDSSLIEPSITRCATKARQARFEHGETP